MSIREQLMCLVELQVAELELCKVDAALERIPAERESEQKRVETAGARLSDAESEREGSLKAGRQREGELQTAEVRLDKYREQEHLVKTNEQLWALQGEMRQAQEQIGSIEEQILEQMERADALGETIAQRKRDLQIAEQEVTAALAELDTKRAALEQERAAAAEHAQGARAELDDDLIALYERVKAVRAGVALAEAVDGTCLGCNVRLRPQLYLQVLNLEAPMQCDNCKRILFSRDALELPSSVQIDTE